MTDDKILEKLEIISRDIAQLSEIERRLISFKETAGRISEELKEFRRDFESRLRPLEAAHPINRLMASWLGVGVISVLGAVGGAVMTLVLKH